MRQAALSRRLLKGFGGDRAALPRCPAALVGCGGDDDAATTAGERRRREGVGRDGHVRLQRLRPGAEGGLREGLRRLQDRDRRRREGQHGRPQHLPGADQLLPAGQARTTSFTWFAGYRMQFFAQRGLATDISDVWGKVGANYSDALKNASTGLDGKQYFVPFYYYPWALFYRKSVFEENGYEVPKTLDELKTLGDADEERRADADRVRRQGRLAGDGDLRHPQPAHQRLRLPHAADEGRGVAGRTRRSPRSSTPGASCCRCTRQGSLGRTWQEAAQGLANKKSGMYLLGMFVGQQFEGEAARRPRLLQLPRDRLQRRRRHAGRADRRLHALQEARERGGREGAARSTSPSAEAQNTYLAVGPEQHRHRQRRRHQRLQRAAEEGRRADRRRVEHHAVHGPRHAARTSPRR